jgi:two-component system chemotaxis response regulator CheB
MMSAQSIRALVVDDSALTRRVISAALETAQDITVVGTAANGAECLALVQKLRPDVVTLDVEMPGMNGLEALNRLMASRPIPVIMVSYLTKPGAEITVRAMLAGAVDVVAKPGGPIMGDLAGLRDELIRKVRAAARSRPRISGRTAPLAPLARSAVDAGATARTTPPAPAGHVRSGGERFDRLVVIGASTGGPQALQVVMSDLVVDTATAYLLVQHMPRAMTSVLAEMLDECSALTVREARSNDRLEAATALLAPGDFHLRLGPGGVVHLDQGPKVHWVRPSVDVALLSVAELYGNRTVATILTGIGDDGADGAVAIHAAGGCVIVEDESTSIVWGMPKAAADRGVVDSIVPLHEVSRTIVRSLRTVGRSKATVRA